MRPAKLAVQLRLEIHVQGTLPKWLRNRVREKEPPLFLMPSVPLPTQDPEAPLFRQDWAGDVLGYRPLVRGVPSALRFNGFESSRIHFMPDGM